MNNSAMPVLLGSKHFYDKNLICRKDMQNFDETDFYKMVDEKQLRRKKNLSDLNKFDIPFILMKLEMSDKKYQDKRGSIKRFENIKFGVQEFFIVVEETVLNSSINFFKEISSIFKEHIHNDVKNKDDLKD
jgi:hypothetical protein